MSLTWPIPLLVVLFASISAPAEEADEQKHAALTELVEQYFGTTDRSGRTALVAEIRKSAGESVAAVAAAMMDAQLWESIDESADEIAVSYGPGRHTRIAVTLPDDYDPTKRYPLILAFVDPVEAPAEREWPEAFDDFVVAAPLDIDNDPFNAGIQGSAAPAEWLMALRRRYHLDSDRLYLHGSGIPGDAAFVSLVMHCDLFAAAVIHEATLDVPFRKELQQLLLDNLHDTPLHLMWTEPSLPPSTELEGRQVEIALANRSIVEFARKAGLPIAETMEPWRQFQRIGRRAVRDVRKWFRYPAQGQAGFVRQRVFRPPAWEGDQLDIQVAPEVNRGAFITKFFESKLARLTGRIRGQRIEVTSTHCESVEIRLGPGMVDFDESVVIFYNGNRRFDGHIRPSIATLLASAYADWEFQRPVYVRLLVGDAGRVRPF